ncbi:hypothetical protein [Burkholderia sp. Ac-20365]|uniref:hypothetical protein n=1 Tax=Burkholderia sp. Ac-20365 TaxID=2703897 RepID=UPI00197B1AB1|nr:hypothetical protein [Burkholderia sp. Ac-20365]MBN3761202.1 hypothetical protein [Burkholderia sp. Ac-20365]
MFGKKKEVVAGIVERFGAHSWTTESSGFVVLLEGHNRPYYITHGILNVQVAYPISLTEKGDRVRFTVKPDGSVVVRDFINETLELRFSSAATQVS